MAVVMTTNAISDASIVPDSRSVQMRWETLRPIIQYLYERMPLDSLMSVMEQDYSLKATRAEYHSQLSTWGLSNKRKPRKGFHQHCTSWSSTSVRSSGLPRDQSLDHVPTKAKKTTQLPVRERCNRRKFHASFAEQPRSPGTNPLEQMELPPMPKFQPVIRMPLGDEDSDSSTESERQISRSLAPQRFVHLTNQARWSILHQALLLGVIRGKMLPYLYPTKSAMFSDQFLGSTLSFSLMKIFEALTFIEQQQCGLDELLLTAYLITNNAMTPSTSTADATWAKVGFLAFGKACSVLVDIQETRFRKKQALEFAATLKSEQFLHDPWSHKYVSSFANEDLAHYDADEWEGTMYQVIENLMRFASCNPDWRSIKIQTQLQIQNQRAQPVILNSVEV